MASEESTSETRRLVIVGCGAAKRDPGETYPAKELYTSTYFQKKREFAETCGDRWMILSAEHGLVPPTADLRPYETSIDDLENDEIAQLAHEVNEALTEWIADTESRVCTVEEIVVLAGQRYVDPLCWHEVFTAGVEPTVRFPFQEGDLGGIGEQMAWLDARADGHEQATLMTDGGQCSSGTEREEPPLEPREQCPKCGGSVEVESEDPLEEYCIEFNCEYYRAARFGGGVIRE